jgi:hypothetical protein
MSKGLVLEKGITLKGDTVKARGNPTLKRESDLEG